MFCNVKVCQSNQQFVEPTIAVHVSPKLLMGNSPQGQLPKENLLAMIWSDATFVFGASGQRLHFWVSFGGGQSNNTPGCLDSLYGLQGPSDWDMHPGYPQYPSASVQLVISS